MLNIMFNIERNQRFLLKNGGVTHLCSVEYCVVCSCLLFGISHCLLALLFVVSLLCYGFCSERYQ